MSQTGRNTGTRGVVNHAGGRPSESGQNSKNRGVRPMQGTQAKQKKWVPKGNQSVTQKVVDQLEESKGEADAYKEMLSDEREERKENIIRTFFYYYPFHVVCFIHFNCFHSYYCCCFR